MAAPVSGRLLNYFAYFGYYMLFRDVGKKKGKCGNFEKTGGGGSTQIPLPFFPVFNMGDPPTINVSKVLKCKIKQFFFFLNT